MISHSEQLTLDAPIARRTDPLGSFEAAEKITESGAREIQLRDCLGGVRLYPGATSKELAELMDVDRYVTGRRLPELRSEGLVWNHPADPSGQQKRTCVHSGISALTWWPARDR